MNGKFTLFGRKAGNASYLNAQGIANSGEIVGSLYDAAATLAFSRSAGVNTPFNQPGQFSTVANAVNDSGAIAGTASTLYNGPTHGFLFQSGAFTNIDFPGATGSRCLGLNDSGAVVGQYYTSSGLEGSFLYLNGKFTPFAIPFGVITFAQGINNQGMVFGNFTTSVPSAAVGFVATPVN